MKVTKAGPNDKYGDSQGDWQKHYEAYKETMRYAYTGDLHRKMHPRWPQAGPDSVAQGWRRTPSLHIVSATTKSFL